MLGIIEYRTKIRQVTSREDLFFDPAVGRLFNRFADSMQEQESSWSQHFPGICQKMFHIRLTHMFEHAH